MKPSDPATGLELPEEGLQLTAGSAEFSGDPESNKSTLEALLQDSVVHKNLGQDIITTTTDRLKLKLIEFEKDLTTRERWIAPTGILVSLIATLITANFQVALGLSADTWKAIFIICIFLTSIWLILSLRKLGQAWRRPTLDHIIEQIKTKS